MKYNCLKCALIAIYKAWTIIYVLLVFHSSGESVLNKNYKINKSLNFNTVLCVSAYRDNDDDDDDDNDDDANSNNDDKLVVMVMSPLKMMILIMIFLDVVVVVFEKIK